jgi:hypothetical protein
MDLGRFCVCFAANPRDKNSLGQPTATAKAVVSPATAVLLITHVAAQKKESPKDF